ncbi:MAG: hypothetical protein HS115_12730 [Spirochaetales bacterium]|nr:hypothetical protein [Spirochaetales bacterium]
MFYRERNGKTPDGKGPKSGRKSFKPQLRIFYGNKEGLLALRLATCMIAHYGFFFCACNPPRPDHYEPDFKILRAQLTDFYEAFNQGDEAGLAGHCKACPFIERRANESMRCERTAHRLIETRWAIGRIELQNCNFRVMRLTPEGRAIQAICEIGPRGQQSKTRHLLKITGIDQEKYSECNYMFSIWDLEVLRS